VLIRFLSLAKSSPKYQSPHRRSTGRLMGRIPPVHQEDIPLLCCYTDLRVNRPQQLSQNHPLFIRGEGLIPRPLGRYLAVLNPRPIPLKKQHASSFRARYVVFFFQNQFKKDLKLLKKRGNDLDKIYDVIACKFFPFTLQITSFHIMFSL